jgi:ferredoxin
MTKEYGAAVFLGTVVTDAVLQSDPQLHPRYFIDNFCYKCKLCDKVCPAGMFEPEGEEFVLLNGELHPRAKRNCIDLCNISCFGLHGLARDKKWTSWGRHWITSWIEHEPDRTHKRKIRQALLVKGSRTGDSTLRYDLIRRLGSMCWPEEWIEQMPELQNPPEDELERNKVLAKYAEKVGVTGLKDFNVLTCGQCALVCGPDLKETGDRYHCLIESGLVVPGPEGRMVHADTFEEAMEIRKQYPQKIGKKEMGRDARASAKLWHKFYFGIEPKSVVQDLRYKRRLKKALKGKAP